MRVRGHQVLHLLLQPDQSCSITCRALPSPEPLCQGHPEPCFAFGKDLQRNETLHGVFEDLLAPSGIALHGTGNGGSKLDKAVRFGRPVIQDTWVPVAVILDALAAGSTMEDIVRAYGVTLAGIRTVLRYAADAATPPLCKTPRGLSVIHLRR